MFDAQRATLVRDRAIIVEGNTIADVVASHEAPSEGARTVDLSDQIVTPGLIDCHAHLVGPTESDTRVDIIDITPEEEMAISISNARDTVLAGFTTVRDVGTFRAFYDLKLRDEINAGRAIGPNMMCASAFITCPNGGGTLAGYFPAGTEIPEEWAFGVVRTEQDVRDKVNAVLDGGADFIKVIATGAVLIVGTDINGNELSIEQLRAAVEECEKRGTFVAAHAHAAGGITDAANAGARSIEHGSLMDDVAIQAMADNGTYLVADIYCGDYISEQGKADGWPEETLRKNDETTVAQREGFSKAVKAGVKMAFGTDSGVYPHGWNAKQLPYMVRHGLAPEKTLCAATRWAAEMMGWEDKVGAIAPGLAADLVGVAGMELGDLSAFENVNFVMKAGEILKSGD